MAPSGSGLALRPKAPGGSKRWRRRGWAGGRPSDPLGFGVQCLLPGTPRSLRDPPVGDGRAGKGGKDTVLRPIQVSSTALSRPHPWKGPRSHPEQRQGPQGGVAAGEPSGAYSCPSLLGLWDSS